MTGFAREGLIGRDFTDLVSPGQRAELVEHRQAGARRRQPRGRSTSRCRRPRASRSRCRCRRRRCSPSTAARCLAFRDVTEARALEGELRSTKEFLERLIDSTVDAIIAADMRGNIILFNQGAERLFGYSPGDVIGKLPVWKLYPEGVARADHARAALGRLRRRRAARADAARDRHQGRRARAGVADGVDRLRGRARGRHRRHPHRPARAHPDRAAPARGAGEAAGDREAGARRRARRHHRARAQSAADVGDGLRGAAQEEDVAATTRTSAPSTSSCARPSAWPRSCARSARSRSYETKDYVGSTQILDLDKSTPMADRDAETTTGQRAPRRRARPSARPSRRTDDEARRDEGSRAPRARRADAAVARGGDAGRLRAVAPALARGARRGAHRHLRLDAARSLLPGRYCACASSIRDDAGADLADLRRPLATGVDRHAGAPLGVKRSALRRTRLRSGDALASACASSTATSASSPARPPASRCRSWPRASCSACSTSSIRRRYDLVATTTSRWPSRSPTSSRWRCATSTSSARRATTATTCAR